MKNKILAAAVVISILAGSAILYAHLSYDYIDINGDILDAGVKTQC